MTLTTLIAIFAVGLALLAVIAYKMADATIAEQKRKEAARKVYQ